MKKNKTKFDTNQIAVVTTVGIFVAIMIVVAIIFFVTRDSNNSDDINVMDESTYSGNDMSGDDALQAALEAAIQDQLENQMPFFPNFTYEIVIGNNVLTAAEYNLLFDELLFDRHALYSMRLGMPAFNMGGDLSAQMHPSGTYSWEEYIHNAVAREFALYLYAVESGIVLDDASIVFISETEEFLQMRANDEEMEVNAFIGSQLPGITLETYIRWVERNRITSSLRREHIEYANFTNEDIYNFHENNWQDFNPASGGEKDPDHTVNIRHILVLFPDDATEQERNDAHARAQELYDRWRAGEATEESFALLATQYTEDEFSADMGGLYAEVWPGMMQEAFDTWLFEPHRAAGDTDLVETMFGIHIMYFAGANEPLWMQVARLEMERRHLDGIIQDKVSGYDIVRRVAG